MKGLWRASSRRSQAAEIAHAYRSQAPPLETHPEAESSSDSEASDSTSSWTTTESASPPPPRRSLGPAPAPGDRAPFMIYLNPPGGASYNDAPAIPRRSVAAQGQSQMEADLAMARALERALLAEVAQQRRRDAAMLAEQNRREREGLASLVTAPEVHEIHLTPSQAPTPRSGRGAITPRRESSDPYPRDRDREGVRRANASVNTPPPSYMIAMLDRAPPYPIPCAPYNPYTDDGTLPQLAGMGAPRRPLLPPMRHGLAEVYPPQDGAQTPLPMEQQRQSTDTERTSTIPTSTWKSTRPRRGPPPGPWDVPPSVHDEPFFDPTRGLEGITLRKKKLWKWKKRKMGAFVDTVVSATI